MNTIKSTHPQDIKPFLEKLYTPPSTSRKGQNGKLLIVGGSTLFHAASIWAAECASHFVDMVHYASTKENNEIIMSAKKAFKNGMVIPQKDIMAYATEDDAILIGPGMVRGTGEEGVYTGKITKDILTKFPDKKVVLDAGSLQMLDPTWFEGRGAPAILTPHQGEFKVISGIDVASLDLEGKKDAVCQFTKKYKVVVLLKSEIDIISDGNDTYTVSGGNQGLTKGGSGDVLAGATAALYTKSDPVTSAVVASYLIKTTADSLSIKDGYWYNTSDIVRTIPEIFHKIVNGISK